MAVQINRGSVFGEALYQLASASAFNNYVEIGTWNGQGSTKCLVDGLLERDDASCLYSIESSKEMYKKAQKFWQPSKFWRRSRDAKIRAKLHLIYGRIIDVSEVMTKESIVSSPLFKGEIKEHFRLYYESDLVSYQESPLCIGSIPETIDVLLLDGGEFSSYPEYKKLKHRTGVILLDDTRALKCARIREEVLQDPDWSVIVDDLNDRNGYLIASRLDHEKDCRTILEKAGLA